MKDKKKSAFAKTAADKAKKDKFVNYEELYKRALADYQNLQKQTAREKEEFVRYVKSNMIMEFIPIYENLKSAVEHSDENNQWLKGVEYVIKQFEDMLLNNGVQIISPAGEIFNPAEHEAIEKVATEDEKQANKIAKVMKQGYKMGDRIVQPAKVAVFSYES